MGIPKFFRYISERYPLTSQLIEENKIPEFDNLYVDFNGIIHNCSHPNDADAHFRLSEEQIFTSIFAYVDLLFGKIKPKKLFFMAVDGVAPRAKMNQQRSRRFRTAKEAKEVKEKAERKGEKLPDEKAFDSNCITPGTLFMAKLSEQLKYFVNKKITEDANWRDCQVVLSGHDVPGEGEHKIMEYIRKSRAQPDYDPNVRHCLYGLDADLIMLGLLSHDPHFCLLREEVKFGPARKKHNTSLEAINFYLLHLTLMREYLDLEFREIENILPFGYNLERVIDDFILLAVFIGNDFLPHLPDVHIHENGLERLFDIYKRVLPSLDGYLNESGVINTQRLQVVLDHMNEWDREIFEREYIDLNWYKGKQRHHVKAAEKAINDSSSKKSMTKSQRMIFDQVKAFVLENRLGSAKKAILSMPNTFSAGEKAFINTLASELHLTITWDEFDEQDQNLLIWRFPGALEEPLSSSNSVSDEDEWETDDESDEEEGMEAVDRVLMKYEKSKVAMDDENDNFDLRDDQRIKAKMDEWKRQYYWDKMRISYDDPEQMGKFVYRYIEGMQWVMHYYYNGVCSWGWFYDYHYAPRISDLAGVDIMSFDFKLGKPFRPFEQLMGVLPSASKELIPIPYRTLMYEIDSPILDFYPLEFEQDMNGKKAEWEAVVKIPFIQEDRLLAAMKTREHQLTEEEIHRNSFGTSLIFSYNPGEPTVYPSSLPRFFPALYRCQCLMEPYDLPTLDGLHLVQGLCDGVFLGTAALAGFPSLKTLSHHATLGYHGVNIHGSESRNQSMIIHVDNPHEGAKPEALAAQMLGQRVFIGWPFLQEGKISAISNSLFKYEAMDVIPGSVPKVISNPHSPQGLSMWKMKTERIASYYSKRCGVITGDIDVLVHVRPLKGLKRLESGAFVKDYESLDKETEQAVQMTLSNVKSEDPRFKERKAPPLSEEFQPGSKVFFLGEHAYGVAAQVSSTTETTLQVVLAFFPSEKDENDKFKELVQNRVDARYYPSFEVAKKVGLSSKAVSKITSRFMVINSDSHKTNLGLNLKFEAKGQKVIDYSRKSERYWEFSERAVDLIREYKEKFPEVVVQLERNGNDFVKVHNVFPGVDSEIRLRDIKAWLAAKGVRDFEAVSLYCDKVGKETVTKIEELANFATNKTNIKKVIVNGIPRQAVLKPAHAVYRLQNQRFVLGDRVVMVQDSGSVPLSIKGVVIGINAKSMDVVWDVPFMAGSTLGDRCSQYRGSTVEFNSCLNLSNPQLAVNASGSQQQKTQQNNSNVSSRPRIGPRPPVLPPPGQQQASGFRPAFNTSQGNPIQIMSNPNRGRGFVNGRNGPWTAPQRQQPVSPTTHKATHTSANEREPEDDNSDSVAPAPNFRGRGGFRGGYGYAPRGLGPRGGHPFARGGGFRARGGPPPTGFLPGNGRGSYRGRRQGAPPLAVSPA